MLKARGGRHFASLFCLFFVAARTDLQYHAGCMEIFTRAVLFLGLAATALFSGLTTFLGVALLLKADNFVAFALSTVMAFFVLTITLSAKLIAYRHSAIYVFLKCTLPFTAIFGGLMTFLTMEGFIIEKQHIQQIVGVPLSSLFSAVSSSDPMLFWVVVFITLVVSGSPVVLSLLMEVDVREPLSPERLKARLEEDRAFEEFLLTRRLLYLREGKHAEELPCPSPVLTVFSRAERRARG